MGTLCGMLGTILSLLCSVDVGVVPLTPIQTIPL